MHINAAFLVYSKRIFLRSCTAVSGRRGILPKPQRRRRRTGLARRASPGSVDVSTHVPGGRDGTMRCARWALQQHTHQSFGISARSRVRARTIWRCSFNPGFALRPFRERGFAFRPPGAHFRPQMDRRRTQKSSMPGKRTRDLGMATAQTPALRRLYSSVIVNVRSSTPPAGSTVMSRLCSSTSSSLVSVA